MTMPQVDHYFSQHPSSKPRYGLIRAFLRGRFFEFYTASGVFSRKRVDLGTHLLIESMVLPENGSLLDLGCGYGAVGVVAAVLYPRLRVFMVDVNERAIGLARVNAVRNGAVNMEFRCGSLYEPVSHIKFDAILSNPPASAGMKIVLPMIEQAPSRLAGNGVFEVVVRSQVGGKRLANAVKEAFGNVEVLARESGYRVLMSKKP
jgi:16S rRNA (guanine1207-N2)-methyltransferase